MLVLPAWALSALLCLVLLAIAGAFWNSRDR